MKFNSIFEFYVVNFHCSLIIINFNLKFYVSKFLSIFCFCRKLFRKVRQLRNEENSMMNGKGLLGDSSTDPLAINSQQISTDEVIHAYYFTFSLKPTKKKYFFVDPMVRGLRE